MSEDVEAWWTFLKSVLDSGSRKQMFQLLGNGKPLLLLPLEHHFF